MGAELAQLDRVERGRHLEHGTEEDALHAELDRVVQAAERPTLLCLGDLPTVDANSHQALLRARRLARFCRNATRQFLLTYM